jgi:hypothetical protein
MHTLLEILKNKMDLFQKGKNPDPHRGKFVVSKGFGSVPKSTLPDFEKADGGNFEYFPELSLTAL